MKKLRKILLIVCVLMPMCIFFPACSCSGGNDDVGDNKNNTYTVAFVTYSPNTFNIGPYTIIEGERVPEPKRPSMFEQADEETGIMYVYTFIGWYQDKEYTKQWLFGNGVYSDMTLFAKWDKSEK